MCLQNPKLWKYLPNNHSHSKMQLPSFFKTKPGAVLLHILAWTVFYARDIYNYIVDPPEHDIVWLDLSYKFLIISTFYLFFYWIWPKILKPGKYLMVIPGILIGVAYFIGGRYLIQEQLFPAVLGFGNYFIDYDFFFYVDDNFFRAFKMIMYSLAIFLFVEKVATDKKREQKATAQTEAELSFLRSQINPHFLFNMLNYLHTEAYIKDEKLAGSILQLSDLLRYSTQKSNKLGAKLEDEIYHLKNYIELYKKRFGEKCYVNYAQNGMPGHQRVEPLLFIPFVENAFKHGVYTKPESPIEINVDINNDKISFTCSNKIIHSEKDRGSGIGLQNVQQRLKLLYPEKHNLAINEKGDTFRVNLTINLA